MASTSPTVEHAVAELERARARTLGLMDQVTEAQLRRQWSTILSPMVWDLAHVGNYEDLWLVATLAGERVTPPGLDDLYDAFRQPRAGREALPLLGPDAARRYISSVRARAIQAIEDGLMDPTRAAGEAQLLHDAFVLGLVVQHEHQHVETILQSRQAMGEQAAPLHGLTPSLPAPVASRERPTESTWVEHPGGIDEIGTSDDPWAYDNERPGHLVSLAPFRIARDPVTNADWLRFLQDDGYACSSLWHPDGWAWRTQLDIEHPEYWRRAGDGSWKLLRFGTWRDVDPAEPVQHVSWWEADAFARWAGARLPTEQEWEAAARWPLRPAPLEPAPAAVHKVANVGARRDGPASLGSFPRARSAAGCRSMLGDVWEWTASTFEPWPGFAVFPYAEYSEAFFDRGYRVLRGGSWATDPSVCRPTFRNWDLPQRRQLFAGLRLAADVDDPRPLG